jgi:hypothetical protein
MAAPLFSGTRQERECGVEGDTATSTKLLTNVDALTSQRRIRLADASHSIPDFYAVLVVESPPSECHRG